MRVKLAMSGDVKVIDPTRSIRDAARMMADLDCGCLPVRDNDRLIGMITDRDIAVRGVAAGKSLDTPVREVMSPQVMYCFDDQELDDVAKNMADIKVRRLPVVNHSKRLVGILSLADIALAEGPMGAASALCGICEPGGEHSQQI
jgi:CBS domain-containing protein